MNKRVILFLIFLPIISTIIFGELFYKNSLTNVPIIVVNLDDGSFGRNFLKNLRDTPEIKIISVENSADEIEKLILIKKVCGAIVIPQDFSKKISHGESVNVEVIIDNTNTISGGTVTRASQSVISAQSATVLVNSRIAAGWNEFQAKNSFLSVSTRNFYNPTNGYCDFFLTVLIMHSIQIAIVFTIAPNFVEEKNFSTITFKNLIEKIFVYTIIEIAVASICCAIGIKFFGLVCRGNFFEILAIITAFIFAMVNFSLAVGAFAKKDFQAICLTLAYIMPSILFTGAIWPRYSMDKFSLILSYLMPIGYAANDLRNFFVKGTAYGWEFHAMILILFGGIFFFALIFGLKNNFRYTKIISE